MKIIESNGQFNLYGGNSVLTYDKLPADFYEICFHKQKGFWLERHPQVQIKEKIYGNHIEKVNKVLKSFDIFNRNLGVMLSGDKGMGKSLFAKLLSLEAINKGLPVIIVNSYIPGIMKFIDSIQQEALVLFDEFDKTFEEREDYNPQYEVLNTLDGLSVGKKLFMFICNNLEEINNCMLNRPGRIHYHFRFSYPTEEEVAEYLKDNLDKKYYNQIEEVVKFSCMTKINYDCLRAIVFELNNGYEFKESINDLNILNMFGAQNSYKIEVEFKNGKVFGKIATIDFFDLNRNTKLWLPDSSCDYIGELRISFSNDNIDMIKNKDYFATISEINLEQFECNRIQNEKELTEYYTNPNNVALVTLSKNSDKNKNNRFF